MLDTGSRPGGGQENQRRVLQRVTTEKLREAQVVADGYSALHAVKRKDGAMVALAEKFLFLRRREKVRLVVIGDKGAVPIKNIAAVRDIVANLHSDGAADDMDTVFFRQRRKQFLRLRAVLIHIIFQRTRKKSDVPKLRQHDDVGRVFHRGVKPPERRHIFFPCADGDGHLQNRNFHFNSPRS